ncbi:hypothetical protein [Haloferula sp. A504]|uniref:hypothetical protein n=1 Tax=Haloferula sp. A504 TaxID=3373601 RepID=UPI0031C2953D|nr:hypothetical protein [Verrucomicrobiaceae bacterium E54]
MLLPTVTPTTSKGADLLLDLRDLLLSHGHPGKCVSCFFGLLGDLRQPGALKPLRHWLEQHLEVEVSAGGREIDVLPVRLDEAADLESFCHQAIKTVRFDRSFRDRRIQLRFRYKSAA